jgi:hypothetical protein
MYFRRLPRYRRRGVVVNTHSTTWKAIDSGPESPCAESVRTGTREKKEKYFIPKGNFLGGIFCARAPEDACKPCAAQELAKSRRPGLEADGGRGWERRRGARARAGLPVDATSVGGILLAVVPLQGILKIAASSSPSLLDIARNIYSHALHHTRPGPGYFDLDSEAPTMVIRLLTVGRCS